MCFIVSLLIRPLSKPLNDPWDKSTMMTPKRANLRSMAENKPISLKHTQMY